MALHNVLITSELKPVDGGEKVCLGAVRVASYFYDGCASRGDPKKYKVTSTFPGVKGYLGHYETVEQARAMLYLVAKNVLKNLEEV